MSEIAFRTAWQRKDATLARDARVFWQGLGGVVTAQEMDERIPQLCAVAYDGPGVVAVSTTFFYDLPRLRGRFAYYRTTVAPSHRQQNMASRLCSYSRAALQGWAQEHPEERLKGLLIVLQSRDLFPNRRHLPVIRQLDLELILIGYTQGGEQMRIVWFDDAHVE
ncbi:MAG: hypothetical protein KGO02_04130 [Alphaproteobacteria bacterium]|nr:hypothetical protein [Alphaproteobacteria bacterium]